MEGKHKCDPDEGSNALRIKGSTRIRIRDKPLRIRGAFTSL